MVFGVLHHRCTAWHCHTKPSRKLLCLNRRPRACTRFAASATSEHWWDDELEYDAVTETLHAKSIYVAVCRHGLNPDPAFVKLVRSRLGDTPLQTAFSPPSTLPTAQALWQGRCVAPHFFKLRTRDTLEEEGSDVEAFLLELLSQNWKVELDYGLGNQGGECHEALLVVAPLCTAQQLLTAAAFEAPEAPLVMIETQGALVTPVQGGGTATLDQLREQLKPALHVVAADVMRA